jgi:hypothetical protein
MLNYFILDLISNVSNVAEVLAAEASGTRQVGRRLWRENAFEMRDAAFVKNFRLSKSLAQRLIAELEPVIVQNTTYDLQTKVSTKIVLLNTLLSTYL